MRISSFALAAFALAASACGAASTAPGVIRADGAVVAGTWNETGEVPGSSEQWVLSTSWTSVSGTGSWSAEACCGGTVSITGTISNDTLHLNIVRVQTQPPRTQAVDPIGVTAVLTSSADLEATFPGSGSPVHFLKAK